MLCELGNGHRSFLQTRRSCTTPWSSMVQSQTGFWLLVLQFSTVLEGSAEENHKMATRTNVDAAVWFHTHVDAESQGTKDLTQAADHSIPLWLWKTNSAVQKKI